MLFANEISSSYAESLSFNHPNAEVCIEDIRSVSADSIRKGLGLKKGELDLLAGGPPCQGFSVNAPIRSKTDHRNHLFWNYLHFVKAFMPRVLLIENVPGMVSYAGGDTIRAIKGCLTDLGYNVHVRVLYAANFGVPQMRWRTIFLATREDFAPQVLFPVPTHTAPARANFTTKLDGEVLVLAQDYIDINAVRAHVSVEEAIGDLPEIENGGGSLEMAYDAKPATEYQRRSRGKTSVLTNHQCARLGKANLDRLPHIPPGGSWRDIPFDLLPEGMKRARRSDHTKRYGRLDPDGLASTILTKCDPHWGTYVHPNQDRVLSVREAARIQSFPDSHRFFGSVTQQYEQVGNAVPPEFAKAIGLQMSEVLSHYEAGAKLPERFQGRRRQQEFPLQATN